jgi:iron complex transport system ATP-binding protein
MTGPLLQLVGATVRRGDRTLLDAVSVDVAPGEFVAVVGPNGAGKSTLLRAITGEWPSQGQVLFGGRPRGQWDREALARRLAVMTQQPQLSFAFTVREVVALGRLPHRGAGAQADRRVVDAVLSALDLGAFADRSYLGLSGGERQRVQFARVAAQIWEPAAADRPALLLLDEPTSALDLAQQQSVLGLAQRIRARGAAVVAVLHDLNLAARHADRIAMLKAGHVVCIAPPDEAFRPSRLREVFGVDAETLRCPRDDRPIVVVQGLATPLRDGWAQSPMSAVSTHPTTRYP